MENLTTLINIITNLIGVMGYTGITIVVALEYTCIPIPSEVVLPFIGIATSLGEFSLIGALFFSLLGGLIGCIICYYIGYFGGIPLMNFIEKKFPSTKKSIKTLNIWFLKYGKLAVLIARVLPFIRTYVSILAGAEKLKLNIFLMYSSIGIFLWNGALIGLGYFLGDNFNTITNLIGKYSLYCIIIVGLLIILLWYLKHKKKKNN
ncbi:DedA family protein [Clostridium tarantellae]|uniref:DedA family protein n=1 Tax=Clostridium tarantellae TaxID=39493 RepID=A0A6I1MN89_9CLOT|nr:DedA family protein [Clostridium tarantellae]MPQ43577.1 DedA family protein [Clostridium tarantellae]